MSEVKGNPTEDVKVAHADLIAFLHASHGETYDKVAGLIEEKSGLKREQVSYGVFLFVGLYLIFGALAQFLCNMIGFAYPAYASVKAIRTSTKDDDTHWLTYWTVFAFFSLIDFFVDSILHFFPVYFVVKVMFLLYLSLPQTRGAEILYKRFIDPAVAAMEGNSATSASSTSTATEETKKKA